MTVRAALALMLMLLALNGCCGKEDPPCIGWAKRGQTYTVTLEEPIDLKLLMNLGLNLYGLSSCGSDFLGFEPSQTFQVTMGGQNPHWGPSEGCGCWPRVAEFHDALEVERVGSYESGDEAPIADQSLIAFPYACRGTLELAMVEDTLYEPDGGPKSQNRHIFYRVFYAYPPAAECTAARAAVRPQSCVDGWYARVTDPQGKNVPAQVLHKH